MRSEFTKKLQLFRATFGVNQEEIAFAINMSQSNYSRFEQCKLKNPPQTSFKKLARLLCCDWEELKDLYFSRGK